MPTLFNQPFIELSVFDRAGDEIGCLGVVGVAAVQGDPARVGLEFHRSEEDGGRWWVAVDWHRDGRAVWYRRAYKNK